MQDALLALAAWSPKPGHGLMLRHQGRLRAATRALRLSSCPASPDPLATGAEAELPVDVLVAEDEAMELLPAAGSSSEMSTTSTAPEADDAAVSCTLRSVLLRTLRSGDPPEATAGDRKMGSKCVPLIPSFVVL